MHTFSPSSLAGVTQAQLAELQALVKSGHRFRVFQWGDLVESPLEESQGSHSDFFFVQDQEWLVRQRVVYACVAVIRGLLYALVGDGSKVCGALAGAIRNASGGKDVTDYVLVAIRRNLHVVSQEAIASEFLSNLNL